MGKVILHYRLHYLADCIWEQARALERSGNMHLAGELKNIATKLHSAAPTLPAEHGLQHGII